MRYCSLLLITLLLSVTTYAAIGPITGVPSVCQGSHRKLTDTTPGGTWSSSNVAIATIDATGLAHAVSAGTDTITYTVGAGYVMVVITVNPLPAVYAVTGGGKYCAGGKGVLIGLSGSNTDVGYVISGTKYAGTPYGGSGSAGNIWSESIPGIYTVYGINLITYCYSNMTGYAIVDTMPLPGPVTGTNGMCAGSSIVLSDTSAGGRWSSSDTAVAIVSPTTGVVTGVSGFNSAFISYTAPNGCSSSMRVFVDAMPDPVITYNWATNTLYTGAGYATCQWYDSTQGLIPGATSPSIAALNNEYYYVAVTGNGCARTSPLYHFSLGELNINNVAADEQITIFPNPATTELTIEAPPGLPEGEEMLRSVIITDLAGQTVYNLKMGQPAYRQAGVGNLKIDVAGLQPGVYLVKINGAEVRKFVKE